MENTNSSRIRQCFLAAAPLLFGIDASISGNVRPLLLGMVHGAFGICADAPQLALFAALGDNGLGGELAGLVLRPVALLLIGWFVVANLNILVAGHGDAAILWRSISSADLYQLRFCCNGLANVRIDLRGVAFRIGALVRVGEALKQ